MHPEITFDVVPGPTVFGDGSGMLEAQRHSTVTTKHGGIGSDRAHGRAYRVQNTFRIVTLVIRHAVRGFRSYGKHRRLLRPVAVLDMIGSKRAVLLLLANTVAVLRGIAERALVEFRRMTAADVKHDQANRAANGGICPIAGTEGIRAAVHAD